MGMVKARSPAWTALTFKVIPLTWANLQAVSFEAALLFLSSLHHGSQSCNSNTHTRWNCKNTYTYCSKAQTKNT